ncbi:rod shape-determining protein MreD [Sedimentisphaera cyanobacteriorum]|uniref:Rod shape-determining protein MreD n=1 Tax=Sedimentisphaera cyanobacteriorum TaxID=1940790 RepID=A0A1Q2HMB3_9BACT|nr:rod shape-determining protein MreD [Sedimentisphaera cyanobacteriorum]AQQ08500.1 rod shape-determining protein MreD [Sedimentisphaera cyanobacteriorum]
MKWLFFSITAGIAVLLNSSAALEYIEISRFGIRPDLMVPLLGFFCYTFSRRDAITAAFALGFLADVSSITMGPHTLTFLIAGSFFSNAREFLSMDRVRNRAAAVFFLAVFIDILVMPLTGLKTEVQILKPHITIPAEALYTAVAGVVIWQINLYAAGLFGIKRKR